MAYIELKARNYKWKRIKIPKKQFMINKVKPNNLLTMPVLIESNLLSLKMMHANL